jgi:hypothetical protein
MQQPAADIFHALEPWQRCALLQDTGLLDPTGDKETSGDHALSNLSVDEVFSAFSFLFDSADNQRS